MKKKSFLMLQGVCSPLFARLADRLEADGHAVHKVNFNMGDTVFWTPRKASYFRGPLDHLPDFIESLWLKYRITDQILFGDQRPVHRSAVIRAERFGIRTHVLEEGYFRPFWTTLEREGVNGHSLLPRDPDWFRSVGNRLSAPGRPEPFKNHFFIRATYDVCYHLPGMANPLFFHRYKTHAPVNAAVEYAGYINRLTRLKWWRIQDEDKINRLLNRNARYYILPLQLNGDAQIRYHSNFENMQQVIETVLTSFARHAPDNALLVIKNHPLDMGLVNYRKLIRRLERQFDISGRTVYLESGDLGKLLKRAAGCVTVNSTAGGLALELDCPTIALSDPIYNLPGLTFQGCLDAFWRDAAKPEAELYRCYRNTVIHTTQINGGLYCKRGIDLLIDNASPILEAEQSPLEKLL